MLRWFTQSVLQGIGQVMLQNNMYSGILFLVGIFYNSWILGIAALLGAIVGTSTALIFNYTRDDIQNGLYGFNGALTGIATFLFFEVNAVSFLALIIGAALSAPLMKMITKIIPAFTAPFVVLTWLLIYSLLWVFNLPMLTASGPQENSLNILSASVNSFGQVMFQENFVTGLLFLLAILINNRLMAVYALYAAVLGSLIAWLFTAPITAINSGLMGYNAILCAIALSGKNWRDFLWISLAILLSTLFNIGFSLIGIISLTAPFVAATWLIYILKNHLKPQPNFLKK